MTNLENFTPDKQSAIEFLEEAAKYFKNRNTMGEDRAYWSNIYNSENCLKIAQLIKEKVEG